MKKLVLIVMSLWFVASPFTLHSQKSKKADSAEILQAAVTTTKAEIMSQDEKISYALGVNIGENLKSNGITELSFAHFQDGITDAFNGISKFTMEEMQDIFNNLQTRITEKQIIEAEMMKEEGKKFLAENLKRKEVHETPSGLQYEVIVMGKGQKPAATDKVKVHYTGKLIDGTVFDSSVPRGEPIEFVLNQVIRGWTEGLQLMPVGSKFLIYIPSDLGYGDRGQGGIIKGGSTLVFEVELLDIPK